MGIPYVGPTPSAPTDIATVGSITSALSGVTKSTVGLGNVDNTSDINKPISTATQTALNLKAGILTAVSTTTAPTTPVGNNYYLITATAPQTFTLPTSTIGQQIGVMQLSASPTVNTITISGTINGVANAGIMLVIPNEGKIFAADGSGGWAVESSNYGRSGLDSRYLRGMTTRQAITATSTAGAANFTAVAQTMYSVDATNNPVVVTLPSTNIASDLIYIVKSDTSANLVTYTGSVNGTASFTGSVRAQAQGKLFQGDGAGNWNIIAGDISVSALDTRYAPYGAVASPTSNSSTTIPYAATITPNAAAGNIQHVTLTGNVTVNPPTSPQQDQLMILDFAASGGSYTVALSAGSGGFVWGTTTPSSSLTSVTTGTHTRVFAIFNSTANFWSVVGIAAGAIA